ncbi:MAG: hypothetical protein R3E12_15355 [Candidatus Eisenbacteria bacterium]
MFAVKLDGQRQSFLRHLLGLIQTAEVQEYDAEIVEGLADLHLVGFPGTPSNAEAFAVESFGVLRLYALAEHEGFVVERDGDEGVLVPEEALSDVEGLLDELDGFGDLSPQPERGGELVEILGIVGGGLGTGALMQIGSLAQGDLGLLPVSFEKEEVAATTEGGGPLHRLSAPQGGEQASSLSTSARPGSK